MLGYGADIARKLGDHFGGANGERRTKRQWDIPDVAGRDDGNGRIDGFAARLHAGPTQVDAFYPEPGLTPNTIVSLAVQRSGTISVRDGGDHRRRGSGDLQHQR